MELNKIYIIQSSHEIHLLVIGFEVGDQFQTSWHCNKVGNSVSSLNQKESMTTRNSFLHNQFDQARHLSIGEISPQEGVHFVVPNEMELN